MQNINLCMRTWHEVINFAWHRSWALLLLSVNPPHLPRGCNKPCFEWSSLSWTLRINHVGRSLFARRNNYKHWWWAQTVNLLWSSICCETVTFLYQLQLKCCTSFNQRKGILRIFLEYEVCSQNPHFFKKVFPPNQKELVPQINCPWFLWYVPCNAIFPSLVSRTTGLEVCDNCTGGP